MSTQSRSRPQWRWRSGVLVLATLFLSLTLSAGALASQSVSALASQPWNQKLIKLSTDPYSDAGAQHRTQVEPDTFSYGSTIVSAFQSGRYSGGGSMNIGWATTQDGGTTWKHGFLPGTTIYATPPGTFARISDPAVAYDVKHKTWMISSLGIGNSNLAILTSLSTDGGLTWSNPVLVHTGNDDKNWIGCDDGAKSPFYGYCYTEWDIGVSQQHFNEVVMSTSSDGGLHWSKAITPSGAPNGIAGLPLVQPDGTAIVPILGEPTQNTSAIDAFISKNGGKTWSKYFLVSKVFSVADGGGIRSGPLPTAAIDASGKVYVVWEDCRFESKCSANDLVMSTSSDGKTWSKVQRIPLDPVGSGVDHFIPGLAVDTSTHGKTAHLALTYYYYPTNNCNINTCRLYIGFSSSTNAGATWSKKQQVAGPMHLTWLADAGGRFVGDYIAMSFTTGNNAFSVFAVAYPPKHMLYNEAMHTTPEHITGGSLPATSDGVLSTFSTAPVPHSAH